MIEHLCKWPVRMIQHFRNWPVRMIEQFHKWPVRMIEHLLKWPGRMREHLRKWPGKNDSSQINGIRRQAETSENVTKWSELEIRPYDSSGKPSTGFAIRHEGWMNFLSHLPQHLQFNHCPVLDHNITKYNQ